MNNQNPFDVWLLCGVNGSCTDITPLSMIGGGRFGIASFIWNQSVKFENSVSMNQSFSNISFRPTPVCLFPPFVWIVSNNLEESGLINCTKDCYYTMCWNASRFGVALVARIPRWISVPVDAPSSMELFRSKRDFGITAAIITALTVAAVGATAAAVALSQSVQTAATLNNLSSSVAEALDVQNTINGHLKGGIMILNQRVDLVQEQIDTLWQLAQLGCERKSSGLCITSVPYFNNSFAANLSRELSVFLLGNWSSDFDQMVQRLRMSIVNVNSTRVDLSLSKGLMTWISQAVSYLKEWAGMGAFAFILLGILLLCLYCLCRLYKSRRRDLAMLVQAMQAIDRGDSPQVWIASLK